MAVVNDLNEAFGLVCGACGYPLELSGDRLSWLNVCSVCGGTTWLRIGRQPGRDIKMEMVRFAVAFLDNKDEALLEHCRRIVPHVVDVCSVFGLDDDAINDACIAALLHDIGKISVPDSVLNGPSVLDSDEWNLMKTHTIVGERLLSEMVELRPAAQLVRSTHERWDGCGYPDGLAGEDIPLISRIIFACDSKDAMTADRSYKIAMTDGEVRSELLLCSGSQFDPDVVTALLSNLQ